MFRFGILGVSHFAVRRMFPAMRAARGVEIAAIASRDGARANETAATLGIPKAYGSYDELLADPTIDAIYNPLPNHLHVPWSERAVRAGKHVLCEKPVAMNAGEARRLLAVRDETRRLICEAAMVRVHPRWLAARELVRQGKIGALRAFSGTFAYKLRSRDNVRYDKSMGGGVILDTGFYPVTMSRFCFDAEPTEVIAAVEPDPESGVDRLSSALLRFPGGHATLTCGMELLPGQRALLLGSDGHIDVFQAWTPPADRPSELVLETSADLERPIAERIAFEPVDQYTVLVELFARAAQDGDNPGPVPLEDSLKNMAVLDALFRSVVSGRWEKPQV
jgi:predicted dehydrogenase